MIAILNLIIFKIAFHIVIMLARHKTDTDMMCIYMMLLQMSKLSRK